MVYYQYWIRGKNPNTGKWCEWMPCSRGAIRRSLKEAEDFAISRLKELKKMHKTATEFQYKVISTNKEYPVHELILE